MGEMIETASKYADADDDADGLLNALAVPQSQSNQSNKLRSAKTPRKRNPTRKWQWSLLLSGLEDEEDVAVAADAVVGRQEFKVEETSNLAKPTLGPTLPVTHVCIT